MFTLILGTEATVLLISLEGKDTDNFGKILSTNFPQHGGLSSQQHFHNIFPIQVHQHPSKHFEVVPQCLLELKLKLFTMFTWL